MTTNAKTSCGVTVEYDFGSKQAACGSILAGGVTLQCGACRAKDETAAHADSSPLEAVASSHPANQQAR